MKTHQYVKIDFLERVKAEAKRAGMGRNVFGFAEGLIREGLERRKREKLNRPKQSPAYQ